MTKIKNGIFVISLDFELLYGMEDLNIEHYKDSVLKVHKIVPRLLNLFKEYHIHTTWAIIGMIMAKNKDEILEYSPKLKPTYTNSNISTYNHMDRIGYDINDDPYHYGGNLVEMINNTNGQEIASHTFSHYYCNLEGQTKKQFLADLDASIKITNEKCNLTPKTLILPRNQINNEYIDDIIKKGFTNYRGTSNGYVYNTTQNNIIIKTIRTLDGYLGFIKGKCYDINEIQGECLNIKASRFLRPYNEKLKLLEKIKIKSIKDQMLYSAKNNKVFHIWWHPHNFGVNTEENFKQLEELLKYYIYLKEKYGFSNLTMSEVVEEVKL